MPAATCAGVGIAVSHINEGKLLEALEILDFIIGSTQGPHNTGAHIARGTARAMLHDLEGAKRLHSCCSWASMFLLSFRRHMFVSGVYAAGQHECLHCRGRE